MRWQLTVLLAITAALYFFQLGRADIITDESSLATRAIGMVDFDFGIEQPTPWQWVEKIPWWMHLSFHDHPPLVFLLQHYSIRLFGENPFAIRLPSAIAGIAAVIFLYFLGQHLYSPTVGALAALLFAVTVNHVWISRIGLQESTLIALMLASFYCFLRAFFPPAPSRENGMTPQSAAEKKSIPGTHAADRNFLLRKERCRAAMPFFSAGLAGALLGLAFLAKYHALILIPIFWTLLAIRQKPEYVHDRIYFRIFSKKAILAAVLFLVVASPVIMYNIELYRAFGHFDFQFSLLFGQEVGQWPSRPGQEALGSYPNRIKNFIPWLIEANSPYFLLLALTGIAAMGVNTFRTPPRRHYPLMATIAWLLALLVFVGPAHRFLTLLTPWLAIAAGYAPTALNTRFTTRSGADYHPHVLKNIGITSGSLLTLLFLVLLAWEAFYSYNSVVALEPQGARPWTYSYLHRQSTSTGFNELETYLAEKLRGTMPAVAITFEFPFAREILTAATERGRNQKLPAVATAIVYNDNINLSAQLWVFLRRIVYHGWPVASAEDFRRGGAREFFRQSGVQQIYFINATQHALQDRMRWPTADGDLLEADLRALDVPSKEIKNPRGEIAFRVYEFELR